MRDTKIWKIVCQDNYDKTNKGKRRKQEVKLSAFKVECEVVKIKVSPRLGLISEDCPTTSQAKKGGPYTHEARITIVCSLLQLSISQQTLMQVSRPDLWNSRHSGPISPIISED